MALSRVLFAGREVIVSVFQYPPKDYFIGFTRDRRIRGVSSVAENLYWPKHERYETEGGLYKSYSDLYNSCFG